MIYLLQVSRAVCEFPNFSTRAKTDQDCLNLVIPCIMLNSGVQSFLKSALACYVAFSVTSSQLPALKEFSDVVLSYFGHVQNYL